MAELIDLSAQEATAAYNQLVEMLRTRDLGWVVLQVEEKVALGKVREAKLRARDAAIPHELEEPLEAVPLKNRGRTSTATFTVAEEFSPQERLLALVESISMAVPVTNQVAAAAIEAFEEFGSGEGLTF